MRDKLPSFFILILKGTFFFYNYYEFKTQGRNEYSTVGKKAESSPTSQKSFRKQKFRLWWKRLSLHTVTTREREGAGSTLEISEAVRTERLDSRFPARPKVSRGLFHQHTL